MVQTHWQAQHGLQPLGSHRSQVPDRLLMGPGPSNAHPAVLAAQTLPLLGHMHPPMFKIMDDIQEGLRYLFQTDSKNTLLVSGSGVLFEQSNAQRNIAKSNKSLFTARPCNPVVIPRAHAHAPETRCVRVSGHAGMETVIANLLEPGDKIIVGNNGIWGSRVCDLAGRYSGESFARSWSC